MSFALPKLSAREASRAAVAAAIAKGVSPLFYPTAASLAAGTAGEEGTLALSSPSAAPLPPFATCCVAGGQLALFAAASATPPSSMMVMATSEAAHSSGPPSLWAARLPTAAGGATTVARIEVPTALWPSQAQVDSAPARPSVCFAADPSSTTRRFVAVSVTEVASVSNTSAVPSACLVLDALRPDASLLVGAVVPSASVAGRRNSEEERVLITEAVSDSSAATLCTARLYSYCPPRKRANEGTSGFLRIVDVTAPAAAAASRGAPTVSVATAFEAAQPARSRPSFVSPAAFVLTNSGRNSAALGLLPLIAAGATNSSSSAEEGAPPPSSAVSLVPLSLVDSVLTRTAIVGTAGGGAVVVRASNV